MSFRPPCTYCHINFKRKRYLQVHIKNQHTEKGGEEFVCLICGKRFRKENRLREHMNANHFKETDRLVVFGNSEVLNYVKVI